MQKYDPTTFDSIDVNGNPYYKGTHGLDCHSDKRGTWLHGQDLLTNLRNVQCSVLIESSDFFFSILISNCNYFKMFYCKFCGNLFVQTRFAGMTGEVTFDDNGRRKNFTLGLLEITLKRGMAEVK